MNKLLSNKAMLKDYLYILIGTGLVAFATGALYAPTNMVTGGIGGIAIIILTLSKAFVKGGVPLWITNIVLNVPLFFFAYKRHGWKYIIRTIISVILLTIWLMFIPPLQQLHGDLFLTSLFGGIVMGVGIGFVLMAFTTTGGTDLLAVLIHDILGGRFTIGQVMQFVDGIIILGGVVVFGLIPSLYAVFSVYIMSKVADGIIEGTKFAKAAYIVTDHQDDVSNAVFDKLDRGLTSFECTGMYSGAKKNMLLCVVSKGEIMSLRKIVHEVDPGAFIIIDDVHEVFGEGFIEPK